MTESSDGNGSPKRPAHRPSRRSDVIDAATRLFAMRGLETVTVADIADEAGMTSAAVYYHFPSKIDILLEAMRTFSRALVTELDDRVTARSAENGTIGNGAIGDLLTGLLGWLEEHRPAATVYFVTSSGANLAAEALRRETRVELMELFTRAVDARKSPERRIRPAEAGVMATGLLSLVETAAASWLAEDAVLEGLGQRRFLRETAALAERIVGA
ncbi:MULTISPECIES: helix-turn-helix domain-containing protein [unclassified Frankia]|uniref:TetR/AcrR family transcriptional regulator n=1 Tax=unclassified Frankia TaxID=2632575 RepID=UPI002AD492EA|nr:MULTISPECIES: helix-turn-helix domain-containing protein [unclassified Frankia]